MAFYVYNTKHYHADKDIYFLSNRQVSANFPLCGGRVIHVHKYVILLM
mgnify:CR=1